ncbi:hypothetical protein TD95_005009 [Thielaviopsis punctulata]|uniref:Calponin-homology (CH) domain-containing protein n=1 Tax=Thielaviopsis punctulata TaxID=72032 RepID=A0A0F4ZFB4_9PEZI|nr:hypothetical protein TD95_005009 [Thielaviopsis punctulata]
MASVSSLDKDLRRLRLEKYTATSANEVRSWIETVLGEKLSSGDLLGSLRDGVALCKLANLVLPPPGLRFKKSAMPFVQMENISLFLKACQSPPISLPEHDMFLTVDLYEQKDPAQVLQCISSFSRAAHLLDPSKIPTSIGPPVKARPAGAISPQPTGTPTTRARAFSNSSNASSNASRPSVALTATATSTSDRLSPVSPDPSRKVSAWSKKHEEGSTSPAWNIAQYGYIGGASQGNLGIAFGGRRQITASGPSSPSLQQRESLRKKKAEEEERQKREMEEETKRRQAERHAEEERLRLEEERRWAEKTQRARDEERRRQEEEKKRWEEEERQWKLTEEKRKKDEAEAEQRIAEERRRVRSNTRPGSSSSILTDHFLSQYGGSDDATDTIPAAAASPPAPEIDYKSRVKELERELELARQREQEYERERQSRLGGLAAPITASNDQARTRSKSRSARPPSRQDSWSRDQREVLTTPKTPKFFAGSSQTVMSSGPGPSPLAGSSSATTTTGARPLPNPAAYSSPPKTAAGKSLLEKEMERERERQREWENAQEETSKAKRTSDGVEGIGGGIGGRWDVSQFAGYTGGDNLNRTDRGGIGAGRRQIVGTVPRPGV